MTEALLDGPAACTTYSRWAPGCGYQTAVLAPAGRNAIYTIERIDGLQKKTGRACGSRSSACATCGFRGRRMAPRAGARRRRFDGDSRCRLAPLVVPEELTEQLVLGGPAHRAAGPEGKQQLLRITRLEEGLEQKVLGAVSFVPLVGGLSDSRVELC